MLLNFNAKKIVVDASVIVKWFFPENIKELHQENALSLFNKIKKNEIRVVQPPHWLAEATAVIARLDPAIAETATSLLFSLEFPTYNNLETYLLASRLAIELKQHVFDSLYHAVALQIPNAEFITADEKYYKKAKEKGSIKLLQNF